MDTVFFTGKQTKMRWPRCIIASTGFEVLLNKAYSIKLLLEVQLSSHLQLLAVACSTLQYCSSHFWHHNSPGTVGIVGLDWKEPLPLLIVVIKTHVLCWS